MYMLACTCIHVYIYTRKRERKRVARVLRLLRRVRPDTGTETDMYMNVVGCGIQNRSRSHGAVFSQVRLRSGRVRQDEECFLGLFGFGFGFGLGLGLVVDMEGDGVVVWKIEKHSMRFVSVCMSRSSKTSNMLIIVQLDQSRPDSSIDIGVDTGIALKIKS